MNDIVLCSKEVLDTADLFPAVEDSLILGFLGLAIMALCAECVFREWRFLGSYIAINPQISYRVIPQTRVKMRFLMCALLFATCSLPMSLCAQFDDFQLNYCGARGVLGSYLVFLLDIVDPSTSANNSVVCQYDWYAPGMVNSSEVPTDSNISWESSDLNENYVRPAMSPDAKDRAHVCQLDALHSSISPKWHNRRSRLRILHSELCRLQQLCHSGSSCIYGPSVSDSFSLILTILSYNLIEWGHVLCNRMVRQSTATPIFSRKRP